MCFNIVDKMITSVDVLGSSMKVVSLGKMEGSLIITKQCSSLLERNR